MACFSFYPGKNLGAYGEGGAVTTSNAEYARTIRMLRDWGQDRKYHHVLRGYNYRMEGFQGAILRVKLRHLEQWTEARRAVVTQYNEHLADSGVETPTEMPWAATRLSRLHAAGRRSRRPASRSAGGRDSDRHSLSRSGASAASVC